MFMKSLPVTGNDLFLVSMVKYAYYLDIIEKHGRELVGANIRNVHDIIVKNMDMLDKKEHCVIEAFTLIVEKVEESLQRMNASMSSHVDKLYSIYYDVHSQCNVCGGVDSSIEKTRMLTISDVDVVNSNTSIDDPAFIQKFILRHPSKTFCVRCQTNSTNNRSAHNLNALGNNIVIRIMTVIPMFETFPSSIAFKTNSGEKKYHLTAKIIYSGGPVYSMISSSNHYYVEYRVDNMFMRLNGLNPVSIDENEFSANTNGNTILLMYSLTQ